jgi:hypothetical protein
MAWVFCELCRTAEQLHEFDDTRRDYLLTCNHYYYNPKGN